ncbi:MAG: AAA family ATPase [Halobacteriovoraceae bacterium]|nr:AAA family ATPase [Halobacteriovoraceae bacterium]MCB9093482.1 AAA family ATPase [Halobacteriovoraceae bacterium]
MARSGITPNDIYGLLFNTLKYYDCEVVSTTSYGEDYKDFVIIKFERNSKTYVLFIKPLTPSSRNPESEYNFQIIDSQKNKLKELADKLKGKYIYAGWAQDKKCILVAASEKVEKSANQGSVFLAVDKFKEQIDEYKNKVFVRKIAKSENYFSHCFLEENLGYYLDLLNTGTINLIDGSTKGIDDEGFVKFPKNKSSNTQSKDDELVKKTSYPTSNNLILYGPPGTGKTRSAAIIANKLINGEGIINDPEVLNFSDYPEEILSTNKNQYYSTQFHPSFSYEDFFEGLRPVQIQTPEKSDVNYLVVPGVFKAISQLARAYLEKSEYGIDLNVQYLVESNQNGNVTKKWVIDTQSLVGIYRLEDRKGFLTYKDKKVLHTGSGHDDQLVVPEGIEPNVSGVYPVKWYSIDDVNNVDFVLFIDELNRGNPAKIFGEALSLIEDTKRYGRKEQAKITLPYSRQDFVVPPNLHIVCSMNSSDKSLMNLDQAFRRRFTFVYFPPAFEIVDSEQFKTRSKGVFDDNLLTSIKNHFLVINRALKETGISQENHIGHSYLLKLLRMSYFEISKNTKADPREVVRFFLKQTWENELHSQIREIIGEFKLEEFCDNFASESSKVKKDDIYLISGDDVNKLLIRYLSDLQPLADNFPWKKAG